MKLIELIGRSRKKTVEAEVGKTILELALQADVDWGFNCKRGTCSRCRCKVLEGIEYLSEPNKAELLGLDDEELEEGFRLGCQTKVNSDGAIAVQNKPYF
jgi:2Fe-2S ferredoxin